MIIAVIGNYDPPPHVYALASAVGASGYSPLRFVGVV